jgi:hypothetical protein
MIDINLRPPQALSLEEVEEKRRGFSREKRELDIKEKLGMPMTDKERGYQRNLPGIIEYCDEIIDYMTIENLDEFEWEL